MTQAGVSHSPQYSMLRAIEGGGTNVFPVLFCGKGVESGENRRNYA
jgi:hypothetical protein